VRQRFSDAPRRAEDADPAVSDLTGQLQAAPPDGTQQDRDAGAHRRGPQVGGLGGVIGREPVVAPGIPYGFAAQRQPDDLHVLAGAPERMVERLAVPAEGDVGVGHTKAKAEAAAGQAVERGGRQRGQHRRPGRNLHEAGSEADPLRRSGHGAKHRHRVGAETLRHQCHGVPELLGPPGNVDRALVVEEDSQFHLVSLTIVGWAYATPAGAAEAALESGV
jgi:hypothetical protein